MSTCSVWVRIIGNIRTDRFAIRATGAAGEQLNDSPVYVAHPPTGGGSGSPDVRSRACQEPQGTIEGIRVVVTQEVAMLAVAMVVCARSWRATGKRLATGVVWATRRSAWASPAPLGMPTSPNHGCMRVSPLARCSATGSCSTSSARRVEGEIRRGLSHDHRGAGMRLRVHVLVAHVRACVTQVTTC